MDIFKKLFKLNEEELKDDKKNNKPGFHNDFRKPIFFGDEEIDDEIFGDSDIFGFGSPLEMKEFLDKQIKDIIIEQDKDFFDNNPNQNQPQNDKINLDENFEMFKRAIDSDVINENLKKQLESLIKQITPDIKSIIEKPNSSLVIDSDGKSSSANAKRFIDKQQKHNRSIEEKVMDRIHGLIDEDDTNSNRVPFSKKNHNKNSILHPAIGFFDSNIGNQSPPGSTSRIFSQSIITSTMRKPDGTYETKRIVRDSNGQMKTTISRTQEGKTETITYYGDGENARQQDKNVTEQVPKTAIYQDHNGTQATIIQKPIDSSDNLLVNLLKLSRYIKVSDSGYVLPRNLW